MYPPIIALHGNFGSPEIWDEFPIQGIVPVDLWQYSGLSYPKFADQLVEDFASNGRKPILMGYSLGGRLAMNVLSLYPENWSGAVLLSAHSGIADFSDKDARLESDLEWARRVREEPWEEVLRAWNEQTVLANSPVWPCVEQLESRREQIAEAFDNWSLGRQVDLKASLGRFTAPVLWITGEDDEKFTQVGREMDGIFRDFQHVIVPNCGHRVVTKDVAATVSAWLEDRELR